MSDNIELISSLIDEIATLKAYCEDLKAEGETLRGETSPIKKGVTYE